MTHLILLFKNNISLHCHRGRNPGTKEAFCFYPLYEIWKISQPRDRNNKDAHCVSVYKLSAMLQVCYMHNSVRRLLIRSILVKGFPEPRKGWMYNMSHAFLVTFLLFR